MAENMTEAMAENMTEARTEASGLGAEYDLLLELFRLCPMALVQIDDQGAIRMANQAAAVLLRQVAPGADLRDLFAVFDPVAPGLRTLVAGFPTERARICEDHRVEFGPGPGRAGQTLALTLIRLDRGSILVAISDITMIEAAHRDHGALLASVSDGLVVLDPEGRMAEEHSPPLVRWLGARQPGQTFWGYLARTDPAVAAEFEAIWTAMQFEVGWQALVSGPLRLSHYLLQLPRSIQAGATRLSVSYRAVYDDDSRLSQVVLVLRDISSERELERLETAQKELLLVLDRLVRDPGSARAAAHGHRAAADPGAGTIEISAEDHQGLVQAIRGGVPRRQLEELVIELMLRRGGLPPPDACGVGLSQARGRGSDGG